MPITAAECDTCGKDSDRLQEDEGLVLCSVCFHKSAIASCQPRLQRQLECVKRKQEKVDATRFEISQHEGYLVTAEQAQLIKESQEKQK